MRQRRLPRPGFLQRGRRAVLPHEHQDRSSNLRHHCRGQLLRSRGAQVDRWRQDYARCGVFQSHRLERWNLGPLWSIWSSSCKLGEGHGHTNSSAVKTGTKTLCLYISVLRWELFPRFRILVYIDSFFRGDWIFICFFVICMPMYI